MNASTKPNGKSSSRSLTALVAAGVMLMTGAAASFAQARAKVFTERFEEDDAQAARLRLRRMTGKAHALELEREPATLLGARADRLAPDVERLLNRIAMFDHVLPKAGPLYVMSNVVPAIAGRHDAS